MPNFERNLRQTCTYWMKTGTNEYSKPVFASPVVLNCRWEDISEKVVDKHGQEIIAKSKIFTAAELNPEGWLAEGIHDSTIDPTTLDGAEEIRQVKRLPDLRNLKTMYTTWL